MANPNYQPSPELQTQLLTWFAKCGEGRAACFMAGAAAKGPEHVDRHGEQRLPGDFDDFLRCHYMVIACPDFQEQAFPVLRKISTEWDAFIDRWPKLDANVTRTATLNDKYARYAEIKETCKQHDPKPQA